MYNQLPDDIPRSSRSCGQVNFAEACHRSLLHDHDGAQMTTIMLITIKRNINIIDLNLMTRKM